MNRFTWSLKGRVRWFPVTLRDKWINRQWQSRAKRFLVVRHAARKPYFYGQFLSFVAENYPELRRLFELHLLPCRLRDPSMYRLQIPWMQDPLEEWSPRGYRQAVQLQNDCDHHGIPTINRVDRHKNASKLEGACRIARAGLRTPRMAPIADIQAFRENLCGFELPLLIRENYGHGGTNFVVRSPADVAEIPWDKFRCPLAVEFVDVSNPRDGTCVRYRFFAGGDVGFSHSVHVSLGWEVRGGTRVNSNLADNAEYDYLTSSNPHRAQFLEARELLGLDLVAFDYSYDRDGKIVVWEANPHPLVVLSTKNKRAHARWLTDRAFALMLSCYLQKAGMDLPQGLREFTEGQVQSLTKAA